jgi:outer membrane protein assembly factor BamB
MPAIARGRLFLFDRQKDKARLSCLKSETGEPLWTFEYPTDYEDNYGYNDGPRCSPVIDENRVYIYGAEGMLHCLDVLDGKLLWKVDTSSRFNVVQNFFGVASTPVVEGDLLITTVGGSPPGTAKAPFRAQKGNGSGVVAFDKFTGEVRYKITDELAGYASPVLATIAGRRWCFVFARGGLVGFEPATGKVHFHFPWRAPSRESVNAANPVVVDDKVFISETYGPGSALLKVKPGGYEVIWTDAEKGSDKSMQCHWDTPLYHDGYLYAASGRHMHQAELRCIEMDSGKVMWSVPGFTRIALLMIDRHLIGLTEDGKLVLFRIDPQKCDVISTIDLRLAAKGEPRFFLPPCWAAPIVSHGLLYVRGSNRLLCFELIPKKQ